VTLLVSLNVVFTRVKVCFLCFKWATVFGRNEKMFKNKWLRENHTS